MGAYNAHMRARRDAFLAGEDPDTVDKTDLLAAALVHIDSSPSQDDLEAEFTRQVALRLNGMTGEEFRRAELAAEEKFDRVRMARQILAGAPLAANIGA
jgi:hypothetical protein